LEEKKSRKEDAQQYHRLEKTPLSMRVNGNLVWHVEFGKSSARYPNPSPHDNQNAYAEPMAKALPGQVLHLIWTILLPQMQPAATRAAWEYVTDF
jgi:hypothetical protein